MSDVGAPPLPPPDAPQAQPAKTHFANTVTSGIVLCFIMHLFIQFPLLALTMGIASMLLFFTQLFYIVPLVLRARRTGRPELAKGLWIGAGISALLNLMCTGMFWSNFSVR
jgi:hypothetical protein